jgi:DNA-binding CsgD family transcriptional regulator
MKEKTSTLKEWLVATQHAPINRDIKSLLKQMIPALDLLSETHIAAFIYNYEKGGYDFLNDHFLKIMNESRATILKEGIAILQKKVHKEDFFQCLNITQKAYFEYLRMKPVEKKSVQFRFFFRMKKKRGEYAWFMQSSKHFSNGEGEAPMEVGYLIELFDPQHPLKVMGVLETSYRRMEIYPDGIENLLETLSSRELEILRLIKQGFKTKEISSKLQITTNTIKSHRRNMLKKLEVNNMFQAMGLIEAENLN